VSVREAPPAVRVPSIMPVKVTDAETWNPVSVSRRVRA
jgi:hypothetical protein